MYFAWNSKGRVDIFMIDIFGSSGGRASREGRGIHLTRVLPALNYESTRCARLKVERPIKGRERPLVIGEVRVSPGAPVSDYRIRWAGRGPRLSPEQERKRKKEKMGGEREREQE